MSFVCTENELLTDLKGALYNPIPIDDRLWLPNNIEKMSKLFFDNIESMEFPEIAYKVAKNLIKNDIPDTILKNIINECFNFEIPLHNLENNLHIFELFHGPTLTFKDIGARFMSRIIQYFLKDNEIIHIIVATSGDTGSAVADAFFNIPNIMVHILYPKNLISEIQENQMTGYGNNVLAYEVDGNFDDCQSLIKKTLKDKSLCNKLNFFPANSINIARLIPQSLYYFWIYAQLKRINRIENIYITVPSGNLGNITGGILAYKMGLPVKKFIAAINNNKAFYEYLYDNNIKQKKAIPSVSNAMDISIPNNLIRLKSIFENNIEMQKVIDSISISDNETINTIKHVLEKYNYILDPHTAVGYAAYHKILKKNIHLMDNNINGVIISTAHPAKFPEIMKSLNIKYKLPKQIENLNYNGHKISICNNFDEWKNILQKIDNL